MNTPMKWSLVKLMRTSIIPLATTALVATLIAFLATSLIGSQANANYSGLPDPGHDRYSAALTNIRMIASHVADTKSVVASINSAALN
jgi:hypothetical protein